MSISSNPGDKNNSIHTVFLALR